MVLPKIVFGDLCVGDKGLENGRCIRQIIQGRIKYLGSTNGAKQRQRMVVDSQISTQDARRSLLSFSVSYIVWRVPVETCWGGSTFCFDTDLVILTLFSAVKTDKAHM